MQYVLDNPFFLPSHHLALSVSGALYSFGFNGQGQLGLGDNVSKLFPNLVSGAPSLKMVKTGANHVVAFAGMASTTPSLHTDLILDNGDCYVWGVNNRGQLGLNDNNNRNVPIKLDVGQNFTEAALGSEFSLALDGAS